MNHPCKLPWLSERAGWVGETSLTKSRNIRSPLLPHKQSFLRLHIGQPGAKLWSQGEIISLQISVSFFPGGSSNLSLVLGKGYSFGFFRLSKSFLPSSIGVPSQKSAALCLTTKGEKTYNSFPSQNKNITEIRSSVQA